MCDFIANRTDNYPIVGAAFVGDTTLYQEWGPISGRRYRFAANWAPDLKKGQIDPNTGQPYPTEFARPPDIASGGLV